MNTTAQDDTNTDSNFSFSNEDEQEARDSEKCERLKNKPSEQGPGEGTEQEAGTGQDTEHGTTEGGDTSTGRRVAIDTTTKGNVNGPKTGPKSSLNGHKRRFITISAEESADTPCGNSGHLEENRRRLSALSEEEKRELLKRTPKGQYPRIAIPTDFYETIVDWKTVLGESEPMAAILQVLLFSDHRDDEWQEGEEFCGIVLPRQLVFRAFGYASSTAYNRSLNAGMLLELYRQEVDQDFAWTRWNGSEGKARVVKSHGIPQEIARKAKELMLNPGGQNTCKYLVGGKPVQNAGYTSRREERRVEIESQEPLINPPESAKRIQSYLNALDPNIFRHGVYGAFNSERIDQAIQVVRENIAEEQRRDQELRKLYWIRGFPQPLYKFCDRFPRLKADYHNQAMNLPSEVLRAMYTKRDYELDLSKAHLSSYVPVAKREGLEVPTLEKHLEANLSNDEELLEDGDLWTDLAASLDIEVLDDPEARRKAVKKGYAAVYGSTRSNLLYEIYDAYGSAIGDYPDEGFKPLEPLLSHPLMEELLSTRDQLEAIINERGGLEDADGRFIPLSKWDGAKDQENRWRGVMAYVNASYEQKLMGAAFAEAQEERERDPRTRFKIWLYQADGFTVRINSKASHSRQINRLQDAVAQKADELGMPTELEIDYEG